VFALQGLVNQLGQAPVLSVDAGYLGALILVCCS
jgi:hypothetical protein